MAFTQKTAFIGLLFLWMLEQLAPTKTNIAFKTCFLPGRKFLFKVKYVASTILYMRMYEG